MPTFGDRVAVGFSRAVTRRSVLKRSMVAIAATGAAVAAPLRFGERRASAAGTCAHYQNRFGTTCAGSSCGSNRCTSDGGCDLDSTRKRCDTWDVPEDNGNYCWCSSGSCFYPGFYGWYLCCDCWIGAYNNGFDCGTSGGQTRCACKTLVTFGGPC
jgi:hypothetical protein